MKTFFEEYGLASVMAACVMFLVVMASPVGGAINGNLKSTATNMGDTGTEVQAKAGKSIKSLAGEEEPIPEAIYVGLNSSTQTLYFSHSEDSEGYSGCNKKSGDVSNNEEGGISSFLSTTDRYNNVKHVIIENKIKPKGMCCWFYNMHVVEDFNNLDLIDTRNCVTMRDIFSNMDSPSILTLDLNSWDVSNCEDFSGAFYRCKKVNSINVSNWNTTSAKKMWNMFSGCWELGHLNIDNFNTEKVFGINGMFQTCQKLTSLNLSSFNTSNVTDMSDMFNGCKLLTSINYGENFNNNSLIYKTNMFRSCNANKPSWWQ